MIKAICFDFFNTLTYYQPSRERVYIDACKKYGLVLDPIMLSKSLAKADIYWRDQNKQMRSSRMAALKKFPFLLEYITRVVNGSGVRINKFIALDILLHMAKIKWKFVVFDDVIPNLKELKQRGYITGIISNVDRDFQSSFGSMEFMQYIDFHLTSLEAGCDKPAAGIFELALKKAGVEADEAIYIGDQYEQDVLGARNAGMQAILIDRNNLFADIQDCPRIQSLDQVSAHV
jgi:HAD superfamily hydrolase (TIGR01549 family)